MMGYEKSDSKLLRTADDLLELLRHIGFLPLFAGEIAGFSVEERTLASSWWSGDIQSDPWEWRIALAGHPEIAYGKFFDKKAGFIHRDFFPMFANYRRNGYDFDSLFDEGLVPHRAKRILIHSRSFCRIQLRKPTNLDCSERHSSVFGRRMPRFLGKA